MKKVLILVMLMTVLLAIALPMVGFAEQVNTSPPAVDLTPIFQALIALFAALITVKVIPWVKSKTNIEQQLAMMATVKILVYAAEQLYGAGRGDDKLEYVKQSLKAHGYNLDMEKVRAVVEAQVKELTMAQGSTLLFADTVKAQDVGKEQSTT